MHNYYLGFKLMLSYFTVVPVRFKAKDDLSSSSVLAAMLFWLPFAGLLLGGITLGLYFSLEKLGWFAALIAATAYPMLYGFLHTEAVMDVADALYAGHSGKDAYSIIKDPSVGAMGVLWTTGIFLLKTAGISYLLLHQYYTLLPALFIASRMGLQMLLSTRHFRSSFLTAMQQEFHTTLFLYASLFFTAAGLLLTGISFLFLLALALSLSYAAATSLSERLGFMNGDVLGATLELTESLLLIAGALLWR